MQPATERILPLDSLYKTVYLISEMCCNWLKLQIQDVYFDGLFMGSHGNNQQATLSCHQIIADTLL